MECINCRKMSHNNREDGGTYSRVNSPPWGSQYLVVVWSSGVSLTARTLNSDVLPAFWSPIIVISISVALLSERYQQAIRGRFFFDVDPRSGRYSHGMRSKRHNSNTDQNNLNSQSYTLLNRPAMIARLYARCSIVFEGMNLCGLRVGRLPGSCARLRGERVGRAGGIALKL